MSLTGKQSLTRDAARAFKPENPPIASPADLERGSTTPKRRNSVVEYAGAFASDAGVALTGFRNKATEMMNWIGGADEGKTGPGSKL